MRLAAMIVPMQLSASEDECEVLPSIQKRQTMDQTPEARKQKRQKRYQPDVMVLEAQTPEKPAGTRVETPRRRWKRMPAIGATAINDPGEDAVKDVRLPHAFAEDYFSADARGNLKVANAALTSDRAAVCPELARPYDWEGRKSDFAEWWGTMKSGFSLLIRGAGCKRRLLHAFAAEELLRQCAIIVRVDAFDQRFSLCDCLRGVLDHVYTSSHRSGHNVAAIAAAIMAMERTRPLVFLVHNLECLPAVHQTIMAKLSLAPRIYLVASVDSLWAPLAWQPSTLRDFRFSHREVHTYENYDAEALARYPGGMPAWAKPVAGRQAASTARFGIVLRSLTANHGELVQLLAENQLENPDRKGIALSALLDMTTERLIADKAHKLKKLLLELQDHEVVIEKMGPDGSRLFRLACEEPILSRLAKGEPVDGE